MRKVRITYIGIMITVIIIVGFMGGKSWAEQKHNKVVFVPGYIVEMKRFDNLKEYLTENGWNEDDLYVVELQNWNSNITNAEILRDFIDEITAEDEKVDIVAQSMGGISARYYIKNLDGDKKVQNIITTANPHHGTYLAVPGLILSLFGDEGIKELVPGSDFLKELNEDETPGEDVLWTTIRLTSDLIIHPTDSTILAGARNEQVKGVGHINIVEEDMAYPLIKEALQGKGQNIDNVDTDLFLVDARIVGLILILFLMGLVYLVWKAVTRRRRRVPRGRVPRERMTVYNILLDIYTFIHRFHRSNCSGF